MTWTAHALGLVAAVTISGPVRADLALVMVEQDGCVWCAQWNAEIAPVWPKTPEGRAAPLRRIDLHAPLPDDLDFASLPRMTPTFVLTEDGVELDRIEGYAGEDLFWMMVARRFQELGLEVPGGAD